MQLWREWMLYFGLLLLIGLSILLLGLKVTGVAENIWQSYYSLYIALAVAHLWYVFILLFIGDARAAPHSAYAGERIAVIVPVFNEDAEVVEATARSILAADGVKDIFFVNDGSPDPKLDAALRRLEEHPNVWVGTFEQNHGKRVAIAAAIREFVRDHAYVVLVDSDTLLDKYALVRLVEPLSNPRVGASTGDIRLSNEKQNLLTRMVAAYYWSALNIQRKSQSTFGMVPCCSGALSAYRAELLKSLALDLARQHFLGKACTFADDRHLANLVLRSGHDVVYVGEALAYTRTPATYSTFIRQQLRWKRGFYQEAIVAMSFMWRVKPLLFLDILVWELALPLLSIGLVLLLAIYSIIDPFFLFAGVLPSLLLVLIVRHLPLVFFSPQRLPGLVHYMFFNQFVMCWLGLYAIFTLRNRSWSTR